jgi:hypothetical protein
MASQHAEKHWSRPPHTLFADSKRELVSSADAGTGDVPDGISNRLVPPPGLSSPSCWSEAREWGIPKEPSRAPHFYAGN